MWTNYDLLHVSPRLKILLSHSSCLAKGPAKMAYDSAELEGSSGGITLRRARHVTVMFLVWHITSAQQNVIP